MWAPSRSDQARRRWFFLQVQRSGPRARKRLVLEFLRSGADIALGVFERLAASGSRGTLAAWAFGDLDVRTRCHVCCRRRAGWDAGSGALAPLELREECPGVGLQLAAASSSSRW